MIVNADVDPTTSPLNEFLKQYGIWIAVGIAALIFIVVLIFFFIALKKRRQEPFETKKVKNSETVSSKASKVLSSIGGKDNVIEHSCVGSRLTISLEDYSLVDEDGLKKAGVTSLIKMEKKIILVIKDDCSSLYNELFKNSDV